MKIIFDIDNYFVSVPDTNLVIGKYCVTRELWAKIMEIKGIRRYYHRMNGRDLLPMTGITYNDVNDFLIRISHYADLNFSLPTNKEWITIAKEYTLYPGSDDIDRVAWYSGNTFKLMPVGLKNISRNGLYDLAGNVFELTQSNDEYDVECLGGSFLSNKSHCVPGYIIRHISKFNEKEDIGFRIKLNK